MIAHSRLCQNDEDFAQYALFFIENRTDFSSSFSLADTLLHISYSLLHSNIFLVYDAADNIIAWGDYRYITPDYEPDPQGKIAFIDSVIVKKAYRSTRLFIFGFQHMLRHIAEENPGVRTVQFHAQCDNAYLNRLYSKFATIVGEYEGYHGQENVYSTDFNSLTSYIFRIKNDN